MKGNILEILRSGEHLSTGELAQKTGSSPELLLAKLEHYARLDYIKKIPIETSPCQGSCGHCQGCSQQVASGRPLIFWELKK